MEVVIRVTPTVSRIESGILDPDTVNALSEACMYEVPGSKYMGGGFNPYSKKQARLKEWDGKKRLYHKGHRTFGSGLLSRVSEILVNHGYSVSVADESTQAGAVVLPSLSLEWAARDYQRQDILRAFMSGRGMIQVATGGGKTVIAGHLIKAFSIPTVFFVHTKDLLYQAKDTFISMFGSSLVGQVGDGVVDPKVITVCTLQTAAHHLDVKYERDSFAEGDESWNDNTDLTMRGPLVARMLHDCGLVIMDECHRVAAPTATEVLGGVKNAVFRFGMSASPWRDDGADLVLESVFGGIVVKRSASELIDLGYLVAPTIRIKSVPVARFNKKEPYSSIYTQYIVENPTRNAIAVASAVQMLKRGYPTMVLVRQIKHGIEIQRMLTSGYFEGVGDHVPFLSGKDDAQLRKAVIDDIRNNRLRCLVATTIADEGLDIKPLRGLVLAGGGKSSTRALQRVGRVLRPYPGKTSAEVVDFEDNTRILYDHSKARLKIYEQEPRFNITDL